jgi:hypothetical protein
MCRKLFTAKMFAHWNSNYDQPTKSGGICTEHMNTFLKLKQEASGWSDWCQTEDDRRQYINDYYEKEGIWLDPSKFRWNPGLRSLAKLMINMWIALHTYIHFPLAVFNMYLCYIVSRKDCGLKKWLQKIPYKEKEL